MQTTTTIRKTRKLTLTRVTLRDLQAMSEPALQAIFGGRRPHRGELLVGPTTNVGSDCGGTLRPGVGADQIVFPTSVPGSGAGSHCGGTLDAGTRTRLTR